MKTVFITGADRGVGYCLCECFLNGGYHVIAGQYMPDWPWLAALKEAYPQQLTVVPLDVSDTDSVKQAAILTAEAVEHLDILVCCAGIGGGDSYESMRKVYSTNAVGAVRMVESFLPLMQTGMKRLAFVSSEAGVNSLAHRDGGYAYTTSKTAAGAPDAPQLIPQGLHLPFVSSGLGAQLYERQ